MPLANFSKLSKKLNLNPGIGAISQSNTILCNYASAAAAADLVFYISFKSINPGPAHPGYVLPLQIVQIQIRWLGLFAIQYVNLYQQPGPSNLIDCAGV